MPSTFKELKQIAQTRKRKLGNNTYLVVRDDGGYGVRFHDTQVVVHYPDRVVLNSGGWYTRSTKLRFNQYSDIRVYSKAGVWYAYDNYGTEKNFAYTDELTFFSWRAIQLAAYSLIENRRPGKSN